ncbi:biotin transporter BioY [Siminovitchia sp. 179-K 8D1 HS]|uniref:biotin transporter BioY n=1 Tax=Siminovitchia sp. 179-K 8D1 HS TaxID=3142385 RepID=UPI0039A00546
MTPVPIFLWGQVNCCYAEFELEGGYISCCNNHWCSHNVTYFPVQTLKRSLAATILGARQGTISFLVYILLETVGIPVFSGFSAGSSVLVGPTGSFIFGFILTVLFIGWYLEKTSFKFTHGWLPIRSACSLHFIFGTIWLKIAASLSWPEAFASGFAPFIVVPLLKAALASWIGVIVRKRLTTANILLAPN